MNKEVILTGIRANNDLHIGNYFGALLPIIDMAKNRSDKYQVNLFIPDLHSITTPIDHSQLQAQIMRNLKIFAAAGLPLDDPDIRIYRQSFIPAHSELTWILDCFTSFGQMARMTQFKEKSGLGKLKAAKAAEEEILSVPYEHWDDDDVDFVNNAVRDAVEKFHPRVSMGLFNYPVLMAADILLYNAKYIPVGDDQTQHLEFTRDIAERMNKQFGDLFVVPEPAAKQHEFFGKDQGLRIRDLIDPTKKMSKSDSSGKGVIFLGDDPQNAASKILAATTDSVGVVKYDSEKQPGISNLLEIYGLLKNYSPDEIANSWEAKGDYRQLKNVVANYMSEFLKDFQDKLSKVDETKLMDKLKSDEKAMTEVANSTLDKVQKAVGLRQ